MAQGDGRCTTPRNRRSPKAPIVRELTNKIVRARTDHQLTCGCLLARGALYHRLVATLTHPDTKQRAFVAEKGHAGPCPKSGVIN